MFVVFFFFFLSKCCLLIRKTHQVGGAFSRRAAFCTAELGSVMMGYSAKCRDLKTRWDRERSKCIQCDFKAGRSIFIIVIIAQGCPKYGPEANHGPRREASYLLHIIYDL